MEEIYKEYSKVVFYYLLSLTNNTEIAEEIMQETFYSAIKNIGKFKRECTLKTWLCKIAKNKLIDFYKKKSKINEIDINNINEKELIIDSLEEDFINKTEIDNFYKKIYKFDETTRKVIILRIKADISFKEIGNIMGKSEQWARVTYYRAKLRLKEEFKDE